MSTHDEFATWDAAYVLGALSPTERREFEAHLRECDRCSEAVSELAGMPGILSRVPREQARLDLVAHFPHVVGRRPDEYDAFGNTGVSQVR